MDLKHLMKIANTNKTKLANAAGVTLNAIRNYERGKNSPTLNVCTKMAQHLNCSLETLADWNTENIIDKKMLSEEKQKLLDEILNLEAEDTSKVLAFIAGINSTKQ